MSSSTKVAKVIQLQLPTPPSTAGSQTEGQAPLCPGQETTPSPWENKKTGFSTCKVKAVVVHQEKGRLFDSAPKTVVVEPRKKD